jgi:hypothetical protein
MTIHDYIKKFGLTKWRSWPTHDSHSFNKQWMPAMFVEPDTGTTEHHEQFDVYSNPDQTHFVSINTTRKLFRIVHHDLIIFYSKWEPVERNYSISGII